MKLRKFTATISIAFAAGALGISMPAAAKEPTEAAADAMGAMTAVDLNLPRPPAGKGQVLFYRKGGFAGSAVSCSVWENGQKVSSLGGGRFFVMVADPGTHSFSSKTEATDSISVEVQSGQTQFVECKIKMGFMVGRPDLRLVGESDFRAAKKFKLTDDEDMGPGPGALRQAEFLAAQEATGALPSR